MLHAAFREKVWCPTYCLMPDHLHLVWMGMRRESDQFNAMRFLRRQLGPMLKPYKFQHQAHDHVLREDERKHGAFARVCFYVLANPGWAKLVAEGGDWPFSGVICTGLSGIASKAGGFLREVLETLRGRARQRIACAIRPANAVKRSRVCESAVG